MALPTRKKHKKSPSALPKDFLNTVADLFKKQFKDESKGSSYLVYGDIYESEIVFCVSMTHPKSLQAASMHLSMDLGKEVAEKPEMVTEKLKVMVDVAASWFSQCFQSGQGLEAVLEEMKDADPAWQEFDWENQSLFVKLNKDNYALEKAADDFLRKKGFDPNEDLDELEEFINSDEDDGRGPVQ